MNQVYLSTLSVVLMSALALSAILAPFGAIAQENQSSFDTELSGFGSGQTLDVPEFDIPDGANVVTNDSGAAVSKSEILSHFTCNLSANVYEISVGGSVTLDWETSGLTDVTINGEFVNENGNKTYTNILENTTFTLIGTDGNGNECEQQVNIVCEPKEEPKLCEPGDQYYDPENDLSGEIYAEGKGRVTNDSEYCNYKVGLASYEKFDEVIDNQRFFDDDSGIVHANGHLELMVNVPQCAYQIDLFYGHVLKSLDGQRYGDRLLDADHVNGQNYCGDIVKPECPYTSADGTVINFSDDRIFSSRGAMKSRTEPQAVNLPVGTYSVRLVAWDGYASRVDVSQPNEKYKVVVTNDVNVVAETNSTSDLADNVASALFDSQVNSDLELTSAGTFAYALHSVYPDNSSPNSLNPICAVFEKEDEPEEPVAPECPLTPKDGRTIVDFNSSKLRTDKGEGQSRTAAQNLDFAAGTYDITLVSWDGYRNRVNATQPNEQWELQFLAEGSVIGSSNVISDLEDKVLEAQKTEMVNDDYQLTSNADAIRANHPFYPTNASPNSLYPICAAIDEVPQDPVPSCDSFTATPTGITVGQSSTLSWETSNATKVFLNNGIGEVATSSGTYEITPLADLTYTLTVEGVNDQSVTCDVPVTVSEDPVPACVSFTATPDQLGVGGGEVTLAWDTERAVSVSIDQGVGAVGLDGSTTTNVTEGLTYTLTATDGNGDSVTCPAPVAVADPEPVFSCANNVDFSISDSSIDEGDEIVLTWDTTDVDSVDISGINTTALSGSEADEPNRDTTYVLTATKGDETIECPVSVNVDEGGGGGGGSISLRCDLEASSETISRGEDIELTWDTRGARQVSLLDDDGNILFTTDDYLNDEKEEFFDHTITVSPTRDTEYTLIAERGSRDRECTVDIEVEDDIVVLETRDQAPLVAGISLSQVPYTGFEAGPILTALFYTLLIAWALFIAYLLVIRNRMIPSSGSTEVTENPSRGEEIMRIAMQTRPDAFPPTSAREGARASVEEVVPANLPTENTATATADPVAEAFVNPHQVGDALVTELENRAHSQKALLSSDAVRHFIATTEGSVERNEALDDVIVEAKKTYPLEDGWIVINEARMRNLCVTCIENQAAQTDSLSAFVPSTVPEGAGSLAEAIVTRNIVAAYEMIGNRPMFSLADAAADLDAVVRHRKGENTEISWMLENETKQLSDEQLQQMINALTGALDGTYTDEASAVKMAIMKAVKAAG